MRLHFSFTSMVLVRLFPVDYFCLLLVNELQIQISIGSISERPGQASYES